MSCLACPPRAALPGRCGGQSSAMPDERQFLRQRTGEPQPTADRLLSITRGQRRFAAATEGGFAPVIETLRSAQVHSGATTHHAVLWTTLCVSRSGAIATGVRSAGPVRGLS